MVSAGVEGQMAIASAGPADGTESGLHAPAVTIAPRNAALLSLTLDMLSSLRRLGNAKLEARAPA